MVNDLVVNVNGKELSQAALGRALGLSPPAITKLKKQGMPVTSIEAAQAWRVEHQNIAHRKKIVKVIESQYEDHQVHKNYLLPKNEITDDEDDGDDERTLESAHGKARTRREIAEASIAEMREAEMRGELIRVDAIRHALATSISSLRDSFMQLPARLSPILAPETDAAKIHDQLQVEIYQVLEQICSVQIKIDEGDHHELS